MIGEATGLPGGKFVGSLAGEYVGGKFVGHYAERYGDASDSKRREMESDALEAIVETVSPGTTHRFEDAKDYAEGKISTVEYLARGWPRPAPVPTTAPVASPVPILKWLWKWW